MYYVITNECVDCPIINANHDYLAEQYPQLEVKELPLDYNYKGNYIVVNGELVVNPDYEQEQIAQRQTNFENSFLSTSKGNYRLFPKGYANAQQSIDTINNIVTASGGLTEQIANMIIFYDTPDFTKAEQCTDEWLVAHQHHPEPMTTEEWLEFYIEFTTLYVQKMYK